MKIEKLFFVSMHKMLTDSVDLVGKKKGLDVFTINDFEEAYHFVRDLQPQIIMADQDDVDSEVFEKFVAEFAAQIPVAVVGSAENTQISKPIDPIKLLDELEVIYNKFHG